MIYNIRLTGTGLERNRKLSREDISHIRKLYKKGYKKTKIAVIYNVSSSTISYALLSNKKKKLLRESNNKMRRDWYARKTKEERRELSRQWNDSYQQYLEALTMVKYEI